LIDDEYFNRELIKMMINRLKPNFQILAEAEGIRRGYDLIEEIRPDVVFLDIKMPDGSGFDLLKRFKTVDFIVVFITGFDEFSLKGKEHEALDYILKPI